MKKIIGCIFVLLILFVTACEDDGNQTIGDDTPEYMNYSYILLQNLDKDYDVTAFRIGSEENNEWTKNYFGTQSSKYNSHYWTHMTEVIEIDIKIHYDDGTQTIQNKVIPKGKVLIITFDSEYPNKGKLVDVSDVVDFLGLEDYEF